MCRCTLLDGLTTRGRRVFLRDIKILPIIPRLPEESRGVEDERLVKEWVYVLIRNAAVKF